MKPAIGLIDCNNFFVSCERLFRPDLQHKPVLVLSSNDGCVVARSQEVKDMGIPMGVPYFKIKDTVKDKAIAVFSGNLTLYRDISRRVFEVVRTEFVDMEQYSIDEAFVILPDNEAVEVVMDRVRDRVLREVGVPVSIGVARSKTLAKYAAAAAKNSSGCFLLTDELWQKDCLTVPLSHIWGVGRRLVLQYQNAGLQTVGDLLAADTSRIAQLFGVTGVRLQAELQGEYVLKIGSKRPLQKTIMSSRSFGKKTSNKAIIMDAVAYHVRHIAADLRTMDAAAGTIRVSLHTSRYGDYLLRGGSAQTQLTSPTSDTFSLLQLAEKLVKSLYEKEVPYQKVGVVVGDVVPNASVSTSLFVETSSSNNVLLHVIDTLNKSVDGKELITLGSRLKTTQWQAKSGARSGFYTTRWSDLAKVSAR